MKVELKLIAISDTAFIDEDGKLCIVGIFDKVLINAFPGKVSLALSIVLQGSSYQKIQIKIECDDIRIKKITDDLEMASNGRINFIIDGEFEFFEPGIYTFSVMGNREYLGSIKINVYKKNVVH